MKMDRRDWLFVVVITLLSAGLRFFRLGELPPGFHFDEAYNAIDAYLVLKGNRPLFLPANLGREVLYTYWQAGLAALFGLNVYTLRLASALLGLLTVPAAYILIRHLLVRNSRLIATFTALTLAVSLWHIHFSHYGIRVIAMPLLLSATFGCFWFGTQATAARTSVAFLALSGIFAGLSVWTHPSGRLIPIVLIAYALWLFVQRGTPRGFVVQNPLFSLTVTGAAAFVVFLPLGLTFYRRPDWFWTHLADVSVFNDQISGGTPTQALLANALAVLGMFNLQGDLGWTHNLAGRPVFDPLLSIPFLIGVALWAARSSRRNDPDRNALLLLGLWVLVMLSASVFSDDAPDFSRTLPTLPALLVAVGLGLTWIVRALGRWRPWLGWALALLLVGGSASLATYDYFVRFPQMATEYYPLYAVDKLDALGFLEENYAQGEPAEYQIYLSRLWAEHATVRFMRGPLGIKSLDVSDAVVMPAAGTGAAYAFPLEQESRARRLAELWPEAVVHIASDRFGAPVMAVTEASASVLLDWPTTLRPDLRLEARFQEAPTLLGSSTGEATGELTLFWRAEEAMLRDLTTFVHLIDADGRRVGQVDRVPAGGSYPTPDWSPGERVIDRYAPEITDLCAGGETVAIQVGWYQLAADGLRMMRIDEGGDTAAAGTMRLPLRSHPADDLLASKEQLVRVDRPWIPEGLALLGYQVKGESLSPGDALRVDLAWLGNSNHRDWPIELWLRGDGRQEVIWRGKIAPGAAWANGEVICRRVRVNLPADLTAGNYELELRNAPSVDPAAESTAATLGGFKVDPQK